MFQIFLKLFFLCFFMIRQSVFLSYILQLLTINLHLYPNTRHVYMIIFGILLYKISSSFLSTRLRYLLGSLLIMIYLQYPFLFFLTYSYILCNTYYSVSLLVQSIDTSQKVYSLEIISCVLSFIIHVDYSIIYILCIIDGILNYYKTLPPRESKDLQDVIHTIGYIVVDDYNLKKEEYKFVLSTCSFSSVYTCSFSSVYQERQNKENKIEYVINEKYNILDENESSCSKHESCLSVDEKDTNESYFSVDVFTPLVLVQRDVFSLLLMILRLLPFYRYNLLSFLFIFFYILDYKMISLLISAFCNYTNVRNITSRMISIVVLYYLLEI